jgi:DNA-directed RNA polymerase specialized sigma subunit, sigma54 homolog
MPSEWASVRGAAREDGDYNVEAFLPSEATLAGHLAEQMALLVADPRERLIGQYLIDLVDETGYFTGTLDEVAAKLGAPLAQVEAVLKVLQTLDPSGVGARSLAECLAIQLKERDRYDPAMQALIAHLDLLAKRDLAALKSCARSTKKICWTWSRSCARSTQARPCLRLRAGAAGHP